MIKRLTAVVVSVPWFVPSSKNALLPIADDAVNFGSLLIVPLPETPLALPQFAMSCVVILLVVPV
jgi:hypothetical protein